MKHYARALTIAGSDSGGGAGIQADLKTFAALGCYGMSAITALTAQNTVTVKGIHAVPPAFVAAQLDAVLEDIGVDAVKIGMLANADIIRIVAERLRAHGLSRVILDPVMVAKSGDKLLAEEAVAALRSELIPRVELITPNLPEACLLTDAKAATQEAMAAIGKKLLNLGPRYVLVKGGHFGGAESPDILLTRDAAGHMKTQWFTATRSGSNNTHGTGCTLSSAIAAYRARGLDMAPAVEQSKNYLTEAIRAGADYQLGQGHGPVHHFHGLWQTM